MTDSERCFKTGCENRADFRLPLERLGARTVSSIMVCTACADEMTVVERAQLQLLSPFDDEDEDANPTRSIDEDEFRKLVATLRIVYLRHRNAIGAGHCTAARGERNRTLRSFKISAPELLERADELGMRQQLEDLGVIELLEVH